ncbi:helix-turn-helix transcriptional regulator [Sphingomonas qomolangmaensis]|uniref:YafY family transcriptional regulator n=1 Tax=Sphingomonas qomolangmaensis TaxID=2918765 RepID=A0ABY5LDD9_9SPHN|nr:YafY family protein [Sphingomonas qomolangmaensis]UUL83794.1 YafY family transcriptional regulator [Sphingomonas qomolangmaensis]
MRRADRLLQIIQILRRSTAPVTAAMLASELEVVPRTIYRDIVTLQASRVPIEGEVGLGYVLRGGYDLPPLMFHSAEIDAIVLGLTMVMERGDAGLARGAADALAKVQAVVPPDVLQHIRIAKLLVPHPLEDGVSFGEYVPLIRAAIRENRKLRVDYQDAKGSPTTRTIWPLGLYLFSHVTMIGAWCEVRGDYRAFRTERVKSCQPLDEHFNGRNGAMMAEFVARFQSQQASSQQPCPSGPRADVTTKPALLD